MDKLREYCTPKKNVTFERGIFNARYQGTDRFDVWYTDLRNLVKSCEYRDMEDELLRDIICSGVADKDLYAQLQGKYLPLDKVVEKCVSTIPPSNAPRVANGVHQVQRGHSHGRSRGQSHTGWIIACAITGRIIARAITGQPSSVKSYC